MEDVIFGAMVEKIGFENAHRGMAQIAAEAVAPEIARLTREYQKTAVQLCAVVAELEKLTRERDAAMAALKTVRVTISRNINPALDHIIDRALEQHMVGEYRADYTMPTREEIHAPTEADELLARSANVEQRKSHEEGWVCPVCNLARGSNGHDPCIANLPGVRFACCGHGGANGAEPYIVFENGIRIGFMPRSISYDDGRENIVFDCVGGETQNK